MGTAVDRKPWCWFRRWALAAGLALAAIAPAQQPPPPPGSADIDLSRIPDELLTPEGRRRRNSFRGADPGSRATASSARRRAAGFPVALPAARREAAPTAGGGRPGAELLDTVEPIIPRTNRTCWPSRATPTRSSRWRAPATRRSARSSRPAPPHRRWRSLSSMPRPTSTRCLAPSTARGGFGGGALERRSADAHHVGEPRRAIRVLALQGS